MKKMLSLLIVLTLILSLGACGSSGNVETSESEDAAPSEDISKTAYKMDIESFYSQIAENPVRAEENYKGEIYEVSAFVQDIANDFCILTPLVNPDKSHGTFTIRVELPKEDLMKLNQNERVTVAGVVDQITSNGISMINAQYVDNVYEVKAEITTILYASASDEKPAYCWAIVTDIIDFAVCPRFEIHISGDDLADLNKEDTITVKGTIQRLDNMRDVRLDHGERIACEMKNVELISKTQE